MDSTPVATFVAPDWVLVGPNGPAVIPVPSTTVTGRYAYAIYDEGGLIDANVAGYPSPSPSPTAYVQTIGRKGSAAYANLTAIPTSTASPPATLSALQVNTMVGWRNYASTQPDGDFLNNFKIPPGRWLLEKRLARAAHLLSHSETAILDVVFESGFNDVSNFNRAFKMSIFFIEVVRTRAWNSPQGFALTQAHNLLMKDNVFAVIP